MVVHRFLLRIFENDYISRGRRTSRGVGVQGVKGCMSIVSSPQKERETGKSRLAPSCRATSFLRTDGLVGSPNLNRLVARMCRVHGLTTKRTHGSCERGFFLRLQGYTAAST